MLDKISRAELLGGWVAAVIVMLTGSVLGGANLTIGAGELWLVAAVVPPIVMLILWHGAPPLGVAELLHPVNRSSKEGHP